MEYTPSDYFSDQIGQCDNMKLHVYDECRVIVMSGDRVYCNSFIGKPAIEIRGVCLKCKILLNLLHSINRIDYVDVLRGPSDCMELLNFLNEALSKKRGDDSTIFENGDIIIMDSCRLDNLRSLSYEIFFKNMALTSLSSCVSFPHVNTVL